jgi:hypothetical protein
MNYKNTVASLQRLNWKWLVTPYEITQLMWISYVCAKEFAESLRIALKLYGNNAGLVHMAQGELNTDNLFFRSYNQKGDHYEFLKHFLERGGVLAGTQIYFPEDIAQERRIILPRHLPGEGIYAAQKYLLAVEALPDEVRAMSVFSREEELAGIFSKILQNQIFDHPELAEMHEAYKYYLERHIEIDLGEGGHKYLIKDFPIDDRVDDFYQARLTLYKEAFPVFKEYAK